LTVKENNMDLNEIKKIVQEEKVRVVIVDPDGTSLIVLDYEEYKKLKGVKNEKQEKKEETPNELEEESLKVDDLPF
jgi:C4-type Zn-finger protein